jgi:4-carboxymuconolactone decarboxylase
MNPAHSTTSLPGFTDAGLPERLGPPAELDPDQRRAADELIKGPRRGVYGPFRPLLHRPALLRAVASVGESLRYEGILDAAVREWIICTVSRELFNVFEWEMHLPLAQAAGVPAAALAALQTGQPSPPGLRADLALARTVVRELIAQHRLDESTYAQAQAQWGEPALVELLTLVGYFAMVCWLMNVARTPGPAPKPDTPAA